MKWKHLRNRFRDLIEDPSAVLAYVVLRRMMKEGVLDVPSSDGFIIIIVPDGFRPQSYKTAANMLLNVDSDIWELLREPVRLPKPPKLKQSLMNEPSLFDLRGTRVLLGAHIDEVPREIRFVAKEIVSLNPPTVQDIRTTRRILRFPPLSSEQTNVLLGRPEMVILAGLMKARWSIGDTHALLEIEHTDEQGPSLFELPGFEEQKAWARGLVSDYDRWRQGTLDWKEIEKGALVSGPSGTGKTFLASALATALRFRLIQATVGGWQSAGHLNDMLAAMRRSFDEARKSKGAVLFIDEIDSIGSRSIRQTGDRNETYWQVVINEFLSLMNSPGEGVIVVGATNYPEGIDPAILRSGRLEKHFSLGLPDAKTRAEILNYHAGGTLKLESLMEIANNLKGKSAAALEELVRSARRGARNAGRELQADDLLAVMPERRRYTAEERLRLGVHEAGHALVALEVNHARSAIIEIGESFNCTAESYVGGRTSYELQDDNLPTETVLLDRIAVSLAGMAAEATVFADRSLGAGGVIGSDVELATGIARRMVGSYGFGDMPYFVATPKELIGKPMPDALETEAMKIMHAQYERVLRMLADKKDQLLALAAEAAACGKAKIAINEGLVAQRVNGGGLGVFIEV